MTADWVKSRRCESHACWESRQVEGGVEIRNSTDPERVMFMPAWMWSHLVEGVREGDFDSLTVAMHLSQG